MGGASRFGAEDGHGKAAIPGAAGSKAWEERRRKRGGCRTHCRGEAAAGAPVGCLVSVHSNPAERDACSVGYVDAVTRTHVRLRRVTTHGCEVGHDVRPVEDVFEVGEDGPYMARVEAPANAGGAVFTDVERPRAGTDLVKEAAEAARDTQRYLTLHLPTRGDDATGRVVATTDLRSSLRTADRFGRPGEVLAVPWRDIDSVDHGTEEEQITEFLAEGGSRGATRD